MMPASYSLNDNQLLPGVEVRPMGDRALLLRLKLPAGITVATQLSAPQRYNRMLAARSLALRLQAAVPATPGWPREFVPGYDSVLVAFEPEQLDPALLAEWLLNQSALAITEWHQNGLPPQTSRGLHNIPVIYGGERGPDLEMVARRKNMTPAEVIGWHTATVYTAYMVGFAPGFTYLGALPPEIDSPRLERPRAQVPGGTVAFAAGLTGIYPLVMPGGWNLVGYTPWSLFDPAQDPPIRFLPGDLVRFYPIEAAQIAGLAAAGQSLLPCGEKL